MGELMGRVVDLIECIALIQSFYPGPLPFTGTANSGICGRLEAERGQPFPPDFRHYLHSVVPHSGHSFSAIGSPRYVHPASRLSWRMIGYNYNPIFKQTIAGWRSSWFLFADAGADPIIIDVNDSAEHSPVYQALHGMGVWSFYPIADSIGQFLLCAAAFEHALKHLTESDPVLDDEQGFRLADSAADWLFPFFERHANKYYENWLSIFDNA